MRGFHRSSARLNDKLTGKSVGLKPLLNHLPLPVPGLAIIQTEGAHHGKRILRESGRVCLRLLDSLKSLLMPVHADCLNEAHARVTILYAVLDEIFKHLRRQMKSLIEVRKNIYISRCKNSIQISLRNVEKLGEFLIILKLSTQGLLLFLSLLCTFFLRLCRQQTCDKRICAR